MYLHQKIRGYAYLFKAGEKQFVDEFLDVLKSQLKLLSGENRMRFDPVPQKGSTYRANVQDDLSHLGIRVVDAGAMVYGASSHEGERTGPVAGAGINTNPSTIFSAFGQASSGISTFGLSKPRPTIANLVANQGKKKTSSQLDHEARQTLTNSLRNVALETEDRKQWYVYKLLFDSIDIVS